MKIGIPADIIQILLGPHPGFFGSAEAHFRLEEA